MSEERAKYLKIYKDYFANDEGLCPYCRTSAAYPHDDDCFMLDIVAYIDNGVPLPAAPAPATPAAFVAGQKIVITNDVVDMYGNVATHGEIVGESIRFPGKWRVRAFFKGSQSDYFTLSENEFLPAQPATPAADEYTLVAGPVTDWFIKGWLTDAVNKIHIGKRINVYHNIDGKNYIVKVDDSTVASVSDHWFLRYAIAGQDEAIDTLRAALESIVHSWELGVQMGLPGDNTVRSIVGIAKAALAQPDAGDVGDVGE